jgi:acyl-coenzyme A synthetase/AMP-(fatty) acid ligase
VLFLAEFPLTATGKVQRFRLRELALAQAPAAARGPGEPA